MYDAPQNFINRDFSWLEFNRRVLAEAGNPDVPVLERLKFLAITAGNLDEFFMIRVAILHRLIASKSAYRGPDRIAPADVIDTLSTRIREFVADQYDALTTVLGELSGRGVRLVRPAGYSEQDHAFLAGWFHRELEPVLTPMAIDPGHPFPLLASCSTYIFLQVTPSQAVTESNYASTETVFVQVPAAMPHFVALPALGDTNRRFALLDDIVSCFAERLLHGYTIAAAHPFRITRDADMTVDDEQAKNLLTAVEKELLTRRRGAPVRLEIGADMPASMVEALQKELSLSDRETYRLPGLMSLKVLFQFEALLPFDDLRNAPWPPCLHPELPPEQNIFQVIRKHDLMLHMPYYSFDPVVRLVEAAAADPDVLAIKITLYRVSGTSPLVRALVRAAEAGKQVTALVELRARFDEQANIQWARRLDQAGANVIYGVVGFKTHSKALLVVRREPDGIRRYCHLSTGNYNDKTARLYTDLALFTANPDFGADLSAFFNVITGYSLPPAWRRVTVAPFGLREKVVSLIEREIEKHSPETPGCIRAKMNALTDPVIIAALYKASCAGVRIELLVRGLCRLRPGIAGLSDNIRVLSVIDRLLEHPRIAHFRNGGHDEVYLASADWMERNLDDRVELFFPILSERAVQTALRALEWGLSDTVKAWELQSDGSYWRVEPSADGVPMRSQEALYRHAVATCREASEAAKPAEQQLLTPKSAPGDLPT